MSQPVRLLFIAKRGLWQSSSRHPPKLTTAAAAAAPMPSTPPLTEPRGAASQSANVSCEAGRAATVTSCDAPKGATAPRRRRSSAVVGTAAVVVVVIPAV
eukprot:2409372-Pyramimonas_sp.AAC.1